MKTRQTTEGYSVSKESLTVLSPVPTKLSISEDSVFALEGLKFFLRKDTVQNDLTKIIYRYGGYVAESEVEADLSISLNKQGDKPPSFILSKIYKNEPTTSTPYSGFKLDNLLQHKYHFQTISPAIEEQLLPSCKESFIDTLTNLFKRWFFQRDDSVRGMITFPLARAICALLRTKYSSQGYFVLNKEWFCCSDWLPSFGYFDHVIKSNDERIFTCFEVREKISEQDYPQVQAQLLSLVHRDLQEKIERPYTKYAFLMDFKRVVVFIAALHGDNTDQILLLQSRELKIFSYKHDNFYKGADFDLFCKYIDAMISGIDLSMPFKDTFDALISKTPMKPRPKKRKKVVIEEQTTPDKKRKIE